jgi:two-component system NarL family sensor kinase
MGASWEAIQGPSYGERRGGAEDGDVTEYDELAEGQGASEMKARAASRAAWSLWGLIVALSGSALLLTFLDRAVVDPIDFIPLLSMPVAAVGYGTVGALISARRRNLIGWIFTTIALGFVLHAFSWAYILRGLVAAPGSLPATTLLAWVRKSVLTFAIAPIPLLLLLFPSGRLPSPRWRVVAGILVLGPRST